MHARQLFPSLSVVLFYAYITSERDLILFFFFDGIYIIFIWYRRVEKISTVYINLFLAIAQTAWDQKFDIAHGHVYIYYKRVSNTHRDFEGYNFALELDRTVGN
jgi:hypothetical protein